MLSTPFIKRPFFWILLLIFITAINACGTVDNTAATKGPVDAEPKNYTTFIPVSLEFVDAVTGKKVSDDIEVTLIDPNKLMQLPDRSQPQEITVEKGLLPMFFTPKDWNLSTENPYRLKVDIASKNYLPTFQSVLIDALNPFSQVVLLVPKDLKDSDIDLYSFQTHRDEVGGGILDNDVVLSARFSNEQGEGNDLVLKLSKGTRFLDATGKVITATNENMILETEIAFFSISVPEAAPLLPGGSLITDMLDVNGETIVTPGNPAFFRAITWFKLDMKLRSGDQLINVDRFEVPEGIPNPEARIQLGRSIIDPRTGKNLRSDAQLVLLKLVTDEILGAEYQEDNAKVSVEVDASNPDSDSVSVTERPEVITFINRPTFWTIGVLDSTNCTSVVSVNVTSPFDAPVTLQCQLINPVRTCQPDPGRIPCAGFEHMSRNVTFPRNRTHTINMRYLPENTGMVFVVFKNILGNDQIISDGAADFMTCSSPPDQNLIANDDFTCLRMEVILDFTADDGTVITQKVCDNALWHRTTDATQGPNDNWLFAGFFEDQQIQTLDIIPRIDAAATTTVPTREILIWYNTDKEINFPIPDEVMDLTISDLSFPIDEDGIQFSRTLEVTADGTTCINLSVRLDASTQNIELSDWHDCL